MSQNIQVGIVGGGVSGLLTSLHLSEAKIPHYLFESSPYFGGRAREVPQDEDYFIDTGQHLLSTSYQSFIEVLDKVNPIWKNQCHLFYPWNIKTADSDSYFGRQSSQQLNLWAISDLSLWLLGFKTLKSLKKRPVFTIFLRVFSLSVFALEPEDIPEKTLKYFFKKLIFNPGFYLPKVSLNTLFINPILETIKAQGYARLNECSSIVYVKHENNFTRLHSKKSKYSLQKVIFATSAQSLPKFFPELPAVQSCSISTQYFKHSKHTETKVMINPCSESEWEFFLPGRSTKVQSNSRKGPLLQNQSILKDSKFLKRIHVKAAVSNISCPNLPLLRRSLKALPYKFVGDYLDTLWPCTLESCARQAKKVAQKISKNDKY